MWSIDEEQILVKEFKNKSNEELAKLIGRSKRAVEHRLNKLKLSRGRINPVNEHFFKTWSPDMAYILGFTLADGSIELRERTSRLSYGVAFKDRQVLEYIADCLDFSKSKIKDTIEVRKGKQCSTSRLRIGSKIIVDDLARYHIIPRKTGMERLPSIPAEYRSNFLLGLFDGDGCISICRQQNRQLRFSIVSASEQFLNDLRDLIDLDYGYIKYKGTSCYTWDVYKQSHIDDLKHFMYGNYNFCLDRKRKKFKW